eukprot:scaffold687_cov119-Isochrysis_galbana.AAC.4
MAAFFRQDRARGLQALVRRSWVVAVLRLSRIQLCLQRRARLVVGRLNHGRHPAGGCFALAEAGARSSRPKRRPTQGR